MLRQPRLQPTLFVFLALLITGVAASCGKLGGPDDAITIDIKAKMFSEPALKAANVDVSSHGGEVTPSRQVPDDSARLDLRLDLTLKHPFDITYLPSRKSQRSASGQPGSDQPADVPNLSSDQPQSN